MLMAAAAATHMAGSAHSASSSISPPPPSWHPVVLAPACQHHQVLYDHGLATPSPTTTPTPLRLRPSSRRAGKQRRRPRPSRKLPTTYISADAASFRRMVHQVTGADDMVHQQAAAEFLCCPAPAPPSRAALSTTATLLPTLDTSAFLLGAVSGAGVGGGVPPARPGSSGCHGSAVVVGGPVAALQAEEEACGSGGGGGGFPSMESWDDGRIFQEE